MYKLILAVHGFLIVCGWSHVTGCCVKSDSKRQPHNTKNW